MILKKPAHYDGKHAVKAGKPGAALAGGAGSGISFYLLCVTCLVDGADKALLPATFRALEVFLGLTPSHLALLVLAQGFAAAAAGPFWGNLADCGCSRKRLLITAVISWAVLTAALSCASSYRVMILLRLLNGCALGMLTPIVQSVVAESQSNLGFKFGCLDFFSFSGQVISSITVTTIASQTIMSYQGWRVAFLFVAALSLWLALLLWAFFDEVPREWRPHDVSLSREFQKFMGYFRIGSFRVIVAQGMFGTIPGAALGFMTMYLQYVGLSDFQASLTFSLILAGYAFGSPLGGMIGDWMDNWSEAHGRPLTAQISVMLGMIPTYFLFYVVPRKAEMAPHLATLCFMLGLGASWCSAGCNKPIFARIVPPDSRGSALAWEVALESTSGQLIGPAAVGFLSQLVFGYTLNRVSVQDMPESMRTENANALANALLLATILPWFVCFVLYLSLHCTYKQDLQELRPLIAQ
jgi:MFS family permease